METAEAHDSLFALHYSFLRISYRIRKCEKLLQAFVAKYENAKLWAKQNGAVGRFGSISQH